MEYGIQLASFATILSIMVIYFQNTRIQLISTKLFRGFLIMAMINCVMEMFSYYSVTHVDKVSLEMNLLAHQLFIGSLDVVVLLLYLYVDMKTRVQQRYTFLQLIIRYIPAAVAIFMVISGDVEYHITGDGIYSTGKMVVTAYISVAIYLVMTVIAIVHSEKEFAYKSKRYLYYGIGVWVVIAILQFTFNYVRLSTLGVALIVQFVYIALENPREYIDHDIGTAVNRHAFELMVTEFVERGEPFCVVSIIISNAGHGGGVQKYQDMNRALESAANYLKARSGEQVYHSGENMVSILVTRLDRFMEMLSTEWTGIEYTDTNGKTEKAVYRVTVLECPKYAETVEEIIEMTGYINEQNASEMKNEPDFVNQDIVNKKNYYSAVEKLVKEAVAEKDGFEVYYQPVFSIKENKCISAEALVRLKDTSSGFISPVVFIPVAEKKGLIKELGKIVFENVCRFSRDNKLWERGVQYVSVNLSPIQCEDEMLADTLLGCMEKYEIAPEFINFEVTENVSADERDVFILNMNILKDAGCGFSVDDFGTGYSNLRKLVETKFDVIKLDKSLVWSYFENENENAQVVFDACIDMIKQLGAASVAEGVETQTQAELLKEKNIDFIQGYYYSKPLSESDYIKFIS